MKSSELSLPMMSSSEVATAWLRLLASFEGRAPHVSIGLPKNAKRPKTNKGTVSFQLSARFSSLSM